VLLLSPLLLHRFLILFLTHIHVHRHTHTHTTTTGAHVLSNPSVVASTSMTHACVCLIARGSCRIHACHDAWFVTSIRVERARAHTHTHTHTHTHKHTHTHTHDDGTHTQQPAFSGINSCDSFICVCHHSHGS